MFKPIADLTSVANDARRKRRRYPLLPSVALRTKGTIYDTGQGLYKIWDGTTTRYICQVCNQNQANHPDEKDIRRLCAGCADKKGTKIVKNPCRDCPVGNKTEATYPDEEGKANRVLCSTCADKINLRIIKRQCRNCPVDNPTSANWPDHDGKPNMFCSDCAAEEGLKPQNDRGASMIACECWHRLERVSSAKMTHHRCCDNPEKKWTGKEKEGLLPNRKGTGRSKQRPDVYIEPGLPIHLKGETSGPKGAVLLFHGNYYHGYPPGHPKYNDIRPTGNIPFKELYETTLKDQDRYLKEGMRMFVVWEHEYMTTKRKKGAVDILDVVREVTN